MVNISRFIIKQIVKPSLKFNFDLFPFHCDYITRILQNNNNKPYLYEYHKFMLKCELSRWWKNRET